MPSFWVTEIRTARLTFKNLAPIAIGCRPYLLIDDVYWGGEPLTIPPEGTATVRIGVTMATVGAGAHTVQLALFAMDDVTPLSIAPIDMLNIYEISIEYQGISWE